MDGSVEECCRYVDGIVDGQKNIEDVLKRIDIVRLLENLIIRRMRMSSFGHIS